MLKCFTFAAASVLLAASPYLGPTLMLVTTSEAVENKTVPYEQSQTGVDRHSGEESWKWADQGGKLGMQALLLAAIGALGTAIMWQERRREKDRREEQALRVEERAIERKMLTEQFVRERDSAAEKFELLKNHHEEAVAGFRKRESEMVLERSALHEQQTKLFEAAIKQMGSTESALQELTKFLKERIPLMLVTPSKPIGT